MIQLKTKYYTVAYTILKNYSKELEEKGAELAVVQDKYDATMVKFRARARASYEAGNQSYLEAILTVNAFNYTRGWTDNILAFGNTVFFNHYTEAQGDFLR